MTLLWCIYCYLWTYLTPFLMFLICCTKNFFPKDFFSKGNQIRKKLRIWSHFMKKSLTES